MAEKAAAKNVEAKVVHRFKAAPERVYDAWLDPKTVGVWLKAALMESGLPGELKTIEIDARVGGRFVFSDMRDGGEARHWGTYLVLERPRKVVFTWITDESEEANPSKVTLRIEKDDQACVVTLTHEMDRRWTEFVPRTERGWGRMLQAIDESLARS